MRVSTMKIIASLKFKIDDNNIYMKIFLIELNIMILFQAILLRFKI